LAHYLLLLWYLPVVYLLGRCNICSIELCCPSTHTRPPGFWGLWGMAIAKKGFGYLQVLIGRSLFMYEVGVGADPNVCFFLSGKVLRRDLYRWVRV